MLGAIRAFSHLLHACIGRDADAPALGMYQEPSKTRRSLSPRWLFSQAGLTREWLPAADILGVRRAACQQKTPLAALNPLG